VVCTEFAKQRLSSIKYSPKSWIFSVNITVCLNNFTKKGIYWFWFSWLLLILCALCSTPEGEEQEQAGFFQDLLQLTSQIVPKGHQNVSEQFPGDLLLFFTSHWQSSVIAQIFAIFQSCAFVAHQLS
jgi:hypothetical protein